MKRRLYGNAIPPCCEYCARARRSADGQSVLCPRKGVVPLYHHCRRFRYDPLKRIPKRQPVLALYKEEDFVL